MINIWAGDESRKYGRTWSAERYLKQARKWADRARKRKTWGCRKPLLALAWGYLRLAADAVKRMPEPPA